MISAHNLPDVLVISIPEETGSLPSSENRVPLRVLLAEDEWLLSWSLERHLVRLGIDVTTASNGLEAIRLFEGGNFDWVITDLKLPGKDGFEVIYAARRYQPGIKTILMTAYGSVTVEERAKKVGALYISKPFDLDSIARLIVPSAFAMTK